MSFDEKMRKLPVEEPDDGSPKADEPSPDLGPWGADAVALGGDRRNDPPASDDKARIPQPAARRWVALATLACTVGVTAVLSASALKRDSPTATSDQGTAKAVKEAPTARPNIQRSQVANRAAPQSDQQRLRSQQRAQLGARRKSTAPPRTAPSTPSVPTPSSTYTPSPEPVPPEPGSPSYAPAPAAPLPSPQAKPPAASGEAVAEEFGFER